jgi:hypothetical protein
MPLLFHILKPGDRIKLSDLYARLGGLPLSLPWEPEDIARFTEGESAQFIVLHLEDTEEVGKIMAQTRRYFR